VAGCCELASEASDFITFWTFLDYLRDCYLLNNRMGFFRFFRKISRLYFKLGHDIFFPCSFESIIPLSCHWTLHRLSDWKRLCAVIPLIHPLSWKVAGSIPDDVIGVFSWRIPSSRTVALGSTQRLTEMSTRNLPGGRRPAGTWGWQLHRHLWADCLENVGASTSHNTMGLHGLLQG
jgi:hypothetical protein